MSRIADKHGLTNKYRPAGIGKRVVRRGRSRKYFFGRTRRKSNDLYIDENIAKNTILVIGVLFIILSILVMLLTSELFSVLKVAFMLVYPFVLFPFLAIYGDKKMKIYWNLPNKRESMPASCGWFIATLLEIGVCFFLNLFVILDMLKWYAIIINFAIYILWSAWVLARKNKKIKS